jgi:hypothetical protein
MEKGVLEIVHSPNDPFLPRLQANIPLYKEAAVLIWGPETAVRLVAGKTPPPADRPGTAPAKPVETLDNPAVQTVLQIFGGRVEEIQQHESNTED